VHHLGTNLALDATQIASEYFKWLATQLMGMIGVRLPGPGKVVLLLLGMPAVRLEEREHQSERVAYAVVGGWLVRAPGGTFEFVLTGAPGAFAVLDGFQPRLPWLLYRCTHAWVHDWVMRRFSTQVGLTSEASQGGTE
jgi:hypothetical protein